MLQAIPQAVIGVIYTPRMCPQRFADRYEIQGFLGEGGMGKVWRAYDPNQHMEVALKLFQPGSRPSHAYFEAQVLTALEGDHVLRVYNADTDSDIPFLATRVATEGSAEDALKTRPFGIRADNALTWCRHLLVGLGSCHAAGLLHRDIKPSNLFLDRIDWGMVGDFGLACPLDTNNSAPAAGTFLSMAPEMYLTGQGS